MSRTYETSIKIGATISKAFKSDTHNAASALTKLAAATKSLKVAEASAASLKKLDAELGRSKTRYGTAAAALKKLEEAERAAGGATQESTKWRKAGEREMAKAARELDRVTKASQKHSDVLHKLGVDTSKLTSEQERLTKSLAATERQEKSLERFEHSRERMFGKRKEKTPLFEKAGEQFKGVGESVLHLTEGALVAGEAMHLLVERTMHVGAEVGESAEKLGIGAKALQELRYGAQQSGAQVESLDKSLAKMAINIGKHKIGKGKGGGGAMSIPGMQMLGGEKIGAGTGVDPFKKIGLNAKTLAALKPEEQLKKIADGMLKLKTHAEKAAVGAEIFGKGVTEILPYLSEGAEGIEKLSQKANKFGGVMGDESVAAAIAAEKASKDMNLALSGVANTLGAALLPTAVKAFKGITEWVGNNREAIKKWAESAAKWIETKGLPAFKRIVAEIKSFGEKVIWLVEGAAKLTGGFGNLGIAVGALRLAPLAISLSKIGVEGFKAAAALVRYVIAAKAAKAAGGGIPGGGVDFAAGGKAMGLAASAAMIVGAAAVGYAIGEYIDEKLSLSNKLAKGLGKLTGQSEGMQKIEDQGEVAQKLKNQAVRIQKETKIMQFESQGLSHGQALYAAEHGGAVPSAMPRTGAAGGGVHVAPVIHIHGKATREQLGAGMDKAKQDVLDAHDKRAAHQKRVSFGH